MSEPLEVMQERGEVAGWEGKPKLKIVYRRLDQIAHLPRNAKGHDIGAIVQAMRQFGVIDPLGVNDRTGHDIDGNGRLLALRSMMAETAGRPPKGVLRDGDGMWLVPVVAGIDLSEVDEQRASLALNHTQTLGGYDEADLAAILSDIASAGLLEGTSYDGDDVDMLLRNLSRTGKGPGRSAPYSRPEVTPVAGPDEDDEEEEADEEDETVESLTALADLPLDDDARGWPLISLRLPPDLYEEFRLGVMLLQQVRGYRHFYEALIDMVRDYRSRLTITEGANGAGHGPA